MHRPVRSERSPRTSCSTDEEVGVLRVLHHSGKRHRSTTRAPAALRQTRTPVVRACVFIRWEKDARLGSPPLDRSEPCATGGRDGAAFRVRFSPFSWSASQRLLPPREAGSESLLTTWNGNLEIRRDFKSSSTHLRTSQCWLNLGGLWLNLSARKAGYAVIHLNASLHDVDFRDAFVRISVLRHSWLNVLSAVFGWLYFVAWSVSFYPQIYLNWKRKSVVGLSFDFIGLNLTGFLAYSFFNLGVFFSPVVQNEYYARHPTGVLPVEVNDIVFGLHASLATFITVLQCYFYEVSRRHLMRVLCIRTCMTDVARYRAFL
ncbi:hypothetical protein MTO96_012993 [Rhipicephalus appendiculatus]